MEAAWNTDTICSTVAGCREGPETIQRERERQRAGGEEQRSEKVESTRDVKNCLLCVYVCVYMCVQVCDLPTDANASSCGWLVS